ncbi:MAG TPA: hypothetical protein VGF28_19450 [Thermoanaerobaculia bacterium]
MRKLSLLAVLALSILLFSPAAEAQSACAFDGLCSCNYLDEDFSDLNGWSNNGVDIVTVADPCLWGAPNNDVVQFTDSLSYVSTTFTTTEYESFSVQFSLYLPVDYDDWYDELKVQVTNLDTNVTETRYYRGSDYDTSCNIVWNLSNDYSNADVRVKFTRGTYGTGTIQIDNASFFGNICY